MALGLKDLKRNKQNPSKIETKKESKEDSEFQNPPQETQMGLKERVLGPWQSFDQLEGQTRTLHAQEAVIRARTRKEPSYIESNYDFDPKLAKIAEERRNTYFKTRISHQEKKTKGLFSLLKYLTVRLFFSNN